MKENMFTSPKTALIMLTMAAAAIGQVMKIHTKGGTTPNAFPLAQIDSITYDTGTPLVQPPGTMTLPAQVLKLDNWYLTLPIGTSGSPTEIKQPALATYKHDEYFKPNLDQTGVVFKAHAGGVTTSGSAYPRSELREMASGGTVKAAWSTTSGTHTMFIKEAIIHLPDVKPHVVAGQIHDASNDVMVIRLEGTKLFVDHNGVNGPVLTNDYKLGTIFTVKFVAEGGKVKVYYNDSATPSDDYAVPRDGCYFKAGCYTQSNTTKGDAPTAYGEVVIYDLSVTHN